ncbi:MAG: hypothetical protein Q8K63_08900 [Acidimicrobiales bacterium]|nr:hypothetical protein [Acidimicrobiales bacterium]
MRATKTHSRLAAFVAAVALTVAGLGALSTRTTPAQAETVTPGIKPDFTLSPGQSISTEFQKPLVGSAEVRPMPDPCRENPVLGLTCSTHRIKLTKLEPGYYLRLSVSWLSQSAAGIAVPDIDTYLFTSPSSSFTNAQVGGTTAVMPEQIKLDDPKQLEYDFVVGAYAGAVPGFTIVAEYLNTKGKAPTPAKADIVLNAGERPFSKQITTPMTGYTGAPALYPLVTWNPDECRNDPTRALVCDVYRLKLNRNKAKDAINFVVIELTWEATYTPDLAVVAAGLSGVQNPNLDLIVWEDPVAPMNRDVVGGQESGMPERAAMLATQDEYDIVVQLQNGVNSDYTIRAYMSNEVFNKPFESLEQLEKAQDASAADGVDSDSASDFSGFNDGAVDPELPALDLAPINPDADIAGIGLGVSEQFDANQLSLGGATRNTSAVSKPPSSIALLFTLGLVPILIGVGAVGLLRRRRQSLF